VSDEGRMALLLRLSGPRPPVPAERAARVKAAFHAAWRRELRTRRRRRRLVWALAAALALALGLVARERLAPRPRPQGAAPVAVVEHASGEPGAPVARVLTAGARLVTGPHERLALRLVGGAALRVDHDTRLYLVSASEVGLERGALYLDSGAAAASLTVRTPLGAVRDVGTRFEARLLGATLRVRVREGSVSFGPDGRIAHAGQELRVSPAEPPSVEPARGYGPDWDWVASAAPMPAVDGRPLCSYLDWIAKEKGWTLRFADATARRRAEAAVLHGSLEGLDPDQALGVLLRSSALRSRLVAGELRVEIGP
jgi:ferric-dicitrate binding protein FerR (iron transport regulator)